MTGSPGSGGAFELNPAQRMLAETVYELSRRHVAPRAAEIDENDEYPEDVFELLKSQDLLGLYVPEAYGGSGLGILETCLAIEQMARFCSNSPLFFSVHLLATRPVAIGGSEAQKRTYLAGVARGELRPAFALTEPHAGSDAANIRTRAVRDGDTWVINGPEVLLHGFERRGFHHRGGQDRTRQRGEGHLFFHRPQGRIPGGAP